MSRPRILNAEPDCYSAHARAALEEVADVTEEALDREALMTVLPDYDALIVRLGHRVDAPLLEAGPQLKVVATATTGLDHIDLEAAEDRGIEVLSLRGESEFLRGVVATAEHTWAILLALLRRIPLASAAAREGKWDRDSFRGGELNGKRLGIVGLGRIGERWLGTVRPSAWMRVHMTATGRLGPLTSQGYQPSRPCSRPATS